MEKKKEKRDFFFKKTTHDLRVCPVRPGHKIPKFPHNRSQASCAGADWEQRDGILIASARDNEPLARPRAPHRRHPFHPKHQPQLTDALSWPEYGQDFLLQKSSV